MEASLKSCPFCGGEGELSCSPNGLWSVRCAKCRAAVDCVGGRDEHGIQYRSRDEVVAAWNARADVPERTCRIIPFVEEDGSVVVGNCGECDAVVLYPYEGNYCPNCGAKVVE